MPASFIAKPRALIPVALGLGIAAYLVTRPAKAKGKKSKPKAECPPFRKIDVAKVNEIAKEAVKNGMKGIERVAAEVLVTLYAVDPETNQVIEWPTEPPYLLPAEAPNHYPCLFAAVVAVLTELEPPIPASPVEPINPAVIFNELIATTPTPGKYFKIKKGWIFAGKGIKSILYQAVKKVSAAGANSAKLRMDYLDCINSGPAWNMRFYGSPKTTNTFPSQYLTNGIGMRDAFMPWHDDAISEIVNGRMPVRRIDDLGGKLPGGDGAYGLLWLPPIDTDNLVNFSTISCAPFNWPDGSSSIDPPPELLDLLEPA